MQPKIDPTPEQREIIESADHRLAVTAAAGAGKTFVLVERYLKYVADGFLPDEILTITFTKKAAAEMKRRIVAKLRSLGKMAEAQIAETGPIQTIHSFCERLLRENALEAGIDPKFDILSDTEAGRLRDQAIRETLSSTEFEGTEADRLIGLLAGQRKYRGTSPYGRLEDAIRDVIGGLRGTGLSLDQLRDTYCDQSNFRGCLHAMILDELPLPVGQALRNRSCVDFHAELLQAYKEWGERPPRTIASKSDPEADDQAIWQTVGLFQLAADAWSNFERMIEESQKLDFTSLEGRAIDLLNRSETTRGRIQDQYQVIMVDEAQDVNPLQDELIRLMGIGRELIVGDPQQSIYGFRLADPERFKSRAASEYARQITKNQRSEPGILRAVDLVFGNLWQDYVPMTPPPKPMDFEVVELPFYQGVELWQQQLEGIDQIARWLLEVREEEGLEWGDVAVLVRTADFAQKTLRAFDRQGVPAKIAGGTESFYARLEIRDLANTLRALGNPYDDFALLAMLRSPVVGLSLDSIALLSQSKPVVESLKSFEPTVPEDRAKLDTFLGWFEPMRGVADRLSAWETLSELFAVSDYLPAVARKKDGAQLLANVRKLLRLASSEPALTPLEYAEQIREIQNLRHREGDAPIDDEDDPKVTIMTIHKAKGLEWPAVVVPEMHRKLASMSRDVELDARSRIAIFKHGKKPSFYSSWLQNKRQERDMAEEERLLYVAMTRAKRRLFVVAHNAAHPSHMARKLASAVGLTSKAPVGFVVRSAESS